MNPNIWGPAFWFVLHTISINYPQQPGFLERRNHYDFFRLLQFVLPCETCRNHYSQYFKDHPIENFLGTKEGLTSWVTNLHNSVNQRNNKLEFTQEDSNNLYKSIYLEKSGLENYFCKNLLHSSNLKEGENHLNTLEDSRNYEKTNYWTIFLIIVLVTSVISIAFFVFRKQLFFLIMN
jgi:hypothetical protein